MQRLYGLRLLLADNVRRTLSNHSIHQRFILVILALQVSGMTRIAIAKIFARRFNTTLKNAYSYVLTELQESLIPAGIIEQDGRIKPVRGPTIFRVQGIPCYCLSNFGLLVASCLDEIEIEDRKNLLYRSLASENISSLEELMVREQLLVHLREYPEFTLELVKNGVSKYLEGQINSPFDILPRRRKGFFMVA